MQAIEEAIEVQEDSEHDIFKMEDSDEEEEKVERGEGEGDGSQNCTGRADSVLFQILFHLDNLHMDQANEQSESLFGELLHLFEDRIVHSHHSRHAQYVMFFVCHQQPHNFPKRFVAYLLNKIIRPNLTIQSRISSISCVASYCVRYAQIPSTIVAQAFKVSFFLIFGTCLIFNKLKIVASAMVFQLPR